MNGRETPSAPDGSPRAPASQPAADAPAGQYVVVARRYRPQTFDELIGQEQVARALTNAIAANRVGHAYLFTGARGVGKTSAARILAKALDCQFGPAPAPCNRCDICQSISNGSDVDVLEIDGASNRGIDEIRQLRQNVNIRPSRARFKIYIIDEVHMLTKEAFNALLKTLEEPPEHVKFIFCTTEPGKIPITILSRCQRFDFSGIRSESIQARLEQIAAAEGVAAEPEALALLARRANGSMRDSQSLLEQILSFGGDRITAADVHVLLGTAADARLEALAGHLCRRNAAGALAELDAALGEGVEVGQLLEQLLGYFRDCLAALVGCGADAMLYTTSRQHETLLDIGRQLGLETVLAITQILDQALGRLRYSLQARTLAEIALVRMAALENLDEVATLVAQLRSDASTGGPAAAAKKKPESRPDGSDPAPHVAHRDLSAAATAGDRHSGGPDTLSSETADRIWRQAVAALGGLLADHASFAESVVLAADSGLRADASDLAGQAIAAPNRLVVTFPASYNFHKAACERPQNLAQLETALAEVAGGPVHVECRVAAATAPASDEPRPASLRQRRELAAEHPLVRRAVELFGAQVTNVKDPEAT